ncbi:MAG: cellulase family glycosylhydrolase [bacterium]|nr:cellulase family glycosylhydrolase [bacterium]
MTFPRIFRTMLIAAICALSLITVQSAGASPASETLNARFGKLARGVNLMGWMWYGRKPLQPLTARFTDEDLSLMKNIGLTHVRVPIEMVNVYDANSDDLLNEENVAVLDEGIKTLLNHGLAVVVDLHSISLEQSGGSNYSGPLDSDPEFVETFIAFWSSFARHLSQHDPDWVFLEPMNEPTFRGKPEAWAPIQKRLIAAIRKSAPDHTILATNALWSGLGTFLKLEPLDDPNIVYNFHFYEPFPFTHQGATWSSDNVKTLRDVPYPSSPEAVQPAIEHSEAESAKQMAKKYGDERWNAAKIDETIVRADEWAKKYGVRVTCNEFGAYRRFAAKDDIALWHHDVVAALEKYGIGWTKWEADGGFGMFIRRDGKMTPDESVVKAMGLKVE